MKNILLIILIAANLAGAIACAAPDAQTDDNIFSLTTGFDFSSGRYSASDTTGMLSIPAVGEYEAGPWTFKVIVPSARISGIDRALPRGEHITADSAAIDSQYGRNDTVAAASYNIYSGGESTFGVDLTGKVKLNATDAGFGAGQKDYAAQADAYQSFNKFTALGSLGYKVLGNSAGTSMGKAVYGSFGGSYRLDDYMNGGVDLSLTQNASISGTGRRELSAYVSRKINKNFRAKGYVLKGFTNGSPDSSLGAQIYYGF